VSGTDKPLDEFLRRAYAAGVTEPQIATEDHDEDSKLPAALQSTILDRSAARSSKLLAQLLRSGAAQQGLTPEELVRLATGNERRAHDFVRAGGDPRLLSPMQLAQMLAAADVRIEDWQDLARQAVTSYVLRSPSTPNAHVWGRSSGLDTAQRGAALHRDFVERDTDGANGVAQQYVEEVTRAWTNLTDGDSASQ